jgi:hypothetical protein
VVYVTINNQVSEKEEGAMLWYSKACFRVRKHGTHNPNLVIICETDHSEAQLVWSQGMALTRTCLEGTGLHLIQRSPGIPQLPGRRFWKRSPRNGRLLARRR